MRFQYASNLFVAAHKIPFRQLLPPVAKADSLFLLGNIGRAKSKRTEDFLRYCSDNWRNVYWTLGEEEIGPDSTRIPVLREAAEIHGITLLNQTLSRNQIAGASFIAARSSLGKLWYEEDRDWLLSLPSRPSLIVTNGPPSHRLLHQLDVKIWLCGYGALTGYLRKHKNTWIGSNSAFRDINDARDKTSYLPGFFPGMVAQHKIDACAVRE